MVCGRGAVKAILTLPLVGATVGLGLQLNGSPRAYLLSKVPLKEEPLKISIPMNYADKF